MRHTRAAVSAPAAHPGRWVAGYRWVENYYVYWRYTRCAKSRRHLCKCASDDNAYWHGPYAYVRVPVSDKRTSVVYLGRIDADSPELVEKVRLAVTRVRLRERQL